MLATHQTVYHVLGMKGLKKQTLPLESSRTGGGLGELERETYMRVEQHTSQKNAGTGIMTPLKRGGCALLDIENVFAGRVLPFCV